MYHVRHSAYCGMGYTYVRNKDRDDARAFAADRIRAARAAGQAVAALRDARAVLQAHGPVPAGE